MFGVGMVTLAVTELAAMDASTNVFTLVVMFVNVAAFARRVVKFRLETLNPAVTVSEPLCGDE
jgi:hypothetical protein